MFGPAAMSVLENVRDDLCGSSSQRLLVFAVHAHTRPHARRRSAFEELVSFAGLYPIANLQVHMRPADHHETPALHGLALHAGSSVYRLASKHFSSNDLAERLATNPSVRVGTLHGTPLHPDNAVQFEDWWSNRPSSSVVPSAQYSCTLGRDASRPWPADCVLNEALVPATSPFAGEGEREPEVHARVPVKAIAQWTSAEPVHDLLQLYVDELSAIQRRGVSRAVADFGVDADQLDNAMQLVRGLLDDFQQVERR